jgi:hypothetical protein
MQRWELRTGQSVDCARLSVGRKKRLGKQKKQRARSSGAHAAVDITTAHLPSPERLSADAATVAPLHPNGITLMTPQIAMSIVIMDTDVRAIITAPSAAGFASVRGRLIAGNLRVIPCGDLDHLNTVMTMVSMSENVQETGNDGVMV